MKKDNEGYDSGFPKTGVHLRRRRERKNKTVSIKPCHEEWVASQPYWVWNHLLHPCVKEFPGNETNLVIADTLAEMLVVWVVGKAFELVLDLVGQMARLDHGIDDLFGREFGIKVCYIQNGFHRWFERWLNLLSDESVPIDVA